MLRLSCAFLTLIVVASCSGHISTAGMLPSPSAAALVRHATGSTGKIGHVVVIIQENRSLENLFAGYHGANAPMSG
ncbi:MAG: phospholipase, partial [Candidatus Eremiobacteraeota bacterium]|nr:phospholipase [Candidatus Eremiobacteraeota bacterium]MBV9263806.1 phospholipase [Candidatus Eremiobacteraeota bacterium]